MVTLPIAFVSIVLCSKDTLGLNSEVPYGPCFEAKICTKDGEREGSRLRWKIGLGESGFGT